MGFQELNTVHFPPDEAVKIFVELLLDIGSITPPSE
jgi:hypothetical protein